MVGLDYFIQPIWETSSYPIAVVNFHRDPQRRKLVYVNAAFTQLTGYSRDEAVGLPATLLHGPKTDPVAIRDCEKAVAQGKPCRTAPVHYRKDGSEHAAHAAFAPLVGPHGGADFLMLVEKPILPPSPAAPVDTVKTSGVVVTLFLPMPLKEFQAGELPRHLLSHPEVDDLQALWTKLCGNRRLPRRADFDLKTMVRWASHLSIATVMPKGRLRFRLFGTELTRIYGQDLTGRFLDELAPTDIWSVIILHYQEVVKTLRPLFAPISIANGRWHSEVSRLLLPLAADDDSSGAALIMSADYVRTPF